LGDIYQFGQGLLIRTTGKVVDVERCDFYNNEKIKDNWTFKTGMNTEYTIGHTTEVPEFADDAEVSVEWVDDTSVNIAFNAVLNKDSVEYYEVSAYNVSSDTVDVTKKLSSFYWKNSEEMPKSFVVNLEGLTKQENYRFDVKAYDFWGESVDLTLNNETPEPETVKVTIKGIFGTSLGVSTGGTHNGFYLVTDQNMTDGLWRFYEDTTKQIHHYVFGEGTTYGRKSDICWSGGEYLYVQTYDVYKDGDVIYIPQGLTFTIDDITYEIKNSYKLTCSGGGTSLIAAEGQDIVKVNITGCAEQYSTTATEFYLTTDLNPGLASAEQWKTFCDSGDQFGTPGVATYIRWGAATWLNICRKDHAAIADGTVMTIPKGAKFTAKGITYEIAKTTTITRESGSWKVEVLP
jgi:hypothetical protein